MKPEIMCLLGILFLTFTCCAQKNTKDSPTTQSITAKMELTEAEWKSRLTPAQYYILREKGTEKPFTGEYVFNNDKGIYHCAGCGEALFSDNMKFESHSGWPSFDKEIAGGKIIQSEDNSLGMQRKEITCAKCGGHLGHIFDDGPTQTGQRYCVNLGALSFEPQNAPSQTGPIESITLGAGCFWCVEAVFEELKGVISVESGYSGGKIENPSYKQVCEGNTGHAEVVQVDYYPDVVSLEELLEVFFTLHDPTTLNRQGADVGTQYRSVIFYHNEKQKEIAQRVITVLNENKVFDRPVVTEVLAFNKFYKAENYHQEYYELNKEQPYCKAVIKPKIDKLHKIFVDKLKTK